jgi:hypothetical protein
MIRNKRAVRKEGKELSRQFSRPAAYIGASPKKVSTGKKKPPRAAFS